MSFVNMHPGLGWGTVEHTACVLAGLLVTAGALVFGSAWLAEVVSVFGGFWPVALGALAVCWWGAWSLAFEAVRVHLATS